MRRPRRLAVAALAVAAPFAIGVAVAAPAPDGTTIFAFTDPAVIEASALVVQDGLFLTTNDSGDTGRVFAVDGSGDTVGVTHWSSDPTDCEALAPGRAGHVWVGDIGDNLAQRSSITITRVPVGRGERTVTATSYRLAYPHGPMDAETLVRNPVTGRLYIATKNVFGGTLYAVPAHPTTTGVNRLQEVGHVLPIATDGAFFPDGRHLIVRSYLSAVVYDWPSLQRIGAFALPAQRQGEGIAVAADGRIYLSSEGPRAPVLEIALPPEVSAAMASAPSVSASPSPVSGAAQQPADDRTSRDIWPWALGGVLAVGALLVLVRALRPRGGRVPEDDPGTVVRSGTRPRHRGRPSG
jgi:hypothetical protein